MSPNLRPFTFDARTHQSARLALHKHADDLALEAADRAEQRRLALAELKFDFTAPATRITAWEKLYGLRMPAAVNHVALAVIAQSTGLPLSEVVNEQYARRERAGAKAGTPGISDRDH